MNFSYLKVSCFKQFTVLLSLFALLYVSTLTSAEEVREEMVQMHVIMQELFPLTVETGSLKQKEKEVLQNGIQGLSTHIESLGNSKKQHSQPFQISLEMLQNHLNYTQQATLNGEYSYALTLVRELPQLCSTCHTQDEQIKHFDTSLLKTKFKSDYERAQYHFMTRDYQEALLDYNDHLAKQKKIKQGQHNSEALEKILLIYLNIFKDPNLAQVYFKRLLESDKLNLDIAIDVNHWLHGLDAIKMGPYKIDNTSEIETQVSKILKYEDASQIPIYISEKNKVGAIWLRGLIYDFINRNPNHPDMPKLLYWLASMESALEYGIYYQLPETYLKACVSNFPTHPFAKKCMSQYEAQITFDYTGSSGTHIPDYKKQELDLMKSLLSK